MNRMLIVKDTLTIREEVCDTLLLEGCLVLKTEKEFDSIEDIKKHMHPEVLKLYPSGGQFQIRKKSTGNYHKPYQINP
jgi:hypothetical protein